MTSIGNGAARQAKQAQQARQPIKARQAIRAKQGKPETVRAQQARESRQQTNSGAGLEMGWTVFSYLIGGLIGYGAIGWFVARAVHIQLLFPLGMLVGLAISLSYVIYRYGRQGLGQARQEQAGQAKQAQTGQARQGYGRQGSVERNDR